MKKILLVLTMAAMVAACGTGKKAESAITIISDSLAFPESVLFIGDQMIVPNFGTSELNPLNTEGKGYVSLITDTVVVTMLQNDGNLSAPKGTYIIDDSILFIADVNKLVIYDLLNLEKGVKTVTFPEQDLMLNDIAVKDSTMYITVSNTGNIYSLNIKDPRNIDSTSLTFYTNVLGANGIAINGNSMYIASFPTDMIVTPESVIYEIQDITNPVITKLNTQGGQYDGLAFSEDGKKMYYSNWIGGEIGYIDMDTKQTTVLDLGEVELAGPGRIALHKGSLYIPDMPNSRIIVYKLPETK